MNETLRLAGPIRLVCFDWGGTLMSEAGPEDTPMGRWPQVHAVPGAATCLAELAGRVPLCVATNASVSGRASIERALDRVGFLGHFADIFCYTELGVRGRMAFGDEGRWFVPYYLDVGGGSHVTTWQAAVGAGYRFPWGELQASWRHLEFDQPDGRFVQNLRFSGPAVGATWRF